MHIDTLSPLAQHYFKRLSHFASLPSTNNYLRQHAKTEPGVGHVCVTDRQTAGRGRQPGRQWQSQPGDLTVSLAWRFQRDNLAGLSLAVGLGIAQALGHPALRLKWPNDLYVSSRKLGGILIDLTADQQAIIGIGLNLLPRRDEAIGLAEVGDFPTRDALLLQLLEQLGPLLTRFEQFGFAAWHAEWANWDLLWNQPIFIDHPCGIKRGIARGVDRLGRLRVDTPKYGYWLNAGEVQADTRIRPNVPLHSD